MKLLHDEEKEPNNLQTRFHQLIEVQIKREYVLVKSQEHQQREKNIFDKRAKDRNFDVGEKVLIWDARREAKGKHGIFDNL
jgi:hypothetical protein